jgi:uncharacterized protein YbaR (Trm112 family)|tara:strand:+ start:962 stop:1132 length:171 start_codon:yes stop_codon:yes gene_type:complete
MKEIVCESCEAVFSVRHFLDEIYFEILCCPFCGSQLSDDPDDMDDEMEDEMEDDWQ